MAAGAFTFYQMFKEYMADNTIDLDNTTFDLHLFQSASDYATVTQSILSQLSSEVLSANNYTLAGRPLSVTWATGASGGERRFDASDIIITASGGSIANIRAAVIVARTGLSAKDGTNKLVAYATLSTAQFTINDGSTLTVQFAAGGIFELN